jgi:hypothetical protein
MFLRNVAKLLPHYTASYPRITAVATSNPIQSYFLGEYPSTSDLLLTPPNILTVLTFSKDLSAVYYTILLHSHSEI